MSGNPRESGGRGREAVVAVVVAVVVVVVVVVLVVDSEGILPLLSLECFLSLLMGEDDCADEAPTPL